jgi:hypothetical protein
VTNGFDQEELADTRDGVVTDIDVSLSDFAAIRKLYGELCAIRCVRITNELLHRKALRLPIAFSKDGCDGRVMTIRRYGPGGST